MFVFVFVVVRVSICYLVLLWVQVGHFMSDTSDVCSPEQKQALEILKESLLCLSELPELRSRPSSLFETGYIAYSRTLQFTKDNLPGERGWSWNQSNGRIRIPLGDSRVVCMYKLNPRKKRHQPTPPSYKLWIFSIYKEGEREMDVLWCEKGISTSDDFIVLEYPSHKKRNSTSAPPSTRSCSTPEDTTKVKSDDDKDSHIGSIEEYAFLAPFVDHDVAFEFGWL